MKRLWHDERGSAAIQAAVVAPAVVLLISLVILGGRIALAHQNVQSIAADAARAASLERTANQARQAANNAMATGLDQKLSCANHRLDLDVSGFAKPPGTAAVVTATLTCGVPAADLGLPGLGGRLTVRATMTSPIDTFRERGR